MSTNSLSFHKLPNGWTVGRFDALDLLPGVAHLVTTKQALDVAILRHDHALAAGQLAGAMGLRAVAFCEQVHGNAVHTVPEPPTNAPALFLGPGDGLVTTIPGVGLMMRGADCPLILAADVSRPAAAGVVGAAHASWRGTVAQIAVKLVESMAVAGARLENIVACICPSAGPCCYEVGPEVLDAAVTGIGPHAQSFFRLTSGRYLLDLWSANRDQLLRSGLAERNIHISGLCTICRNDLFPSHRKEGVLAGRFAAVIATT